ncbi:MAG: ribonuclease P protein component 3 [ANME-2 cluster archaeon]|nr:ribonuclease P protein component 3 [ANME-2 cluster archaeon]MCL7475657.1 ribonuclease P protein component 3 [ANME-2 cluster archaeon]MDF1532317.1 RNase P subunit p30 family protein [ANME-2 cluster archaeon]MDW7775384.1 RNase P subunit p30 family protein [Methanosarcinales archaeon]
MGVLKRSRFYDLNVHSLPDCADSPSRLALEANDLGYSGICLTSFNRNNTLHKHDIPHPALKNFEVYTGIEIQVESVSKLTKEVNRLRGNVDFIIIGGGNEDINRAAVENGKVDILAHPTAQGKPLNHVLAKAAADNGVSVDFNMDALIMQRGGSRIKVLAAMRQNLVLARKHGVPMVITSNARSHYDLRTPREMMALAMFFGMTQDEALHSLSIVPQSIIRRNTDRNRIMEGVEVVE